MSKSAKKRFENKENHPLYDKYHTQGTKDKIRIAHLGKHHTQKTKNKMSNSLSSKNNPMYGKHHSKETLKKMSKTFFKKGQIPWNKGKSWGSEILKKMLIRRIPNKEEMYVDNFLKKYNFDYKYVGDGAIIIDGRNPDFINCNGKKKIIEFFGEHWHIPEDEKIKKEIYGRYGYDLLVIWGKDLKDEKQLFSKVQSFEQSDKPVPSVAS